MIGSIVSMDGGHHLRRSIRHDDRRRPNTLWDLIEARAAATPDARPRDRRGRAVAHLRRVPGRRRARRRRARGARRRRGHARVVAAPDLDRVARARRCARRASARCRTRCCRSTASARSASSPSRPARTSSSSRRSGGLRLRGDGAGRSSAGSRRSRCSSVDSDLPEGDPRRCRRRRPRPANRRRRAVRWVFYTSGTTADPKGARHTDPTIVAVGVRDGRRRSSCSPRTGPRSSSRSRTSAGSAGCSRLHDVGRQERRRRGVRPAHDDPGHAAGAGHARGRGHRVPPRLPRRAAREPGPDRCSPRCGLPRRRRAEAAAAALRHQGRDRRRRHRVGLRAHRVPDPRDGVGVHDNDEKLANTEGAPSPGVEIKVVKLDGSIGRPGRGGRDPRQGPAADARATSTRRSTPTRSTRRATSAPATSASSTPTATSTSPAG